MARSMRILKTSASVGALFLVAACSEGGLDLDFRSPSSGDTTEAAQRAVAPRPLPDNRGVISYPNYQVAIARRGDTVDDVAARVGLPAEDEGFDGFAAATHAFVEIPQVQQLGPGLLAGVDADGLQLLLVVAGRVDEGDPHTARRHALHDRRRGEEPR